MIIKFSDADAGSLHIEGWVYNQREAQRLIRFLRAWLEDHEGPSDSIMDMINRQQTENDTEIGA